MTAYRYARRFAALLFATFFLAVHPVDTLAANSRGTDFWLALTAYLQNSTTADVPRLLITAETATSGTVAIPGIGFSEAFTVAPGAVTAVILPADAEVTESDLAVNRGIHVTALAPITVVGFDHRVASTDTYLGLPTAGLGTEYLVLSYTNTPALAAEGGTQFAVVATDDLTTVTITPSVTTGTRAAGVPYTVNLNRGEVYQLRNSEGPSDLSGSVISSNLPVAVLAGQRCANVPPGHAYCNHLVEQLPPVSAWGRQFATVPLATLTHGDTLRVLASVDGTEVRFNGTLVATLNRGQHLERVVTERLYIEATAPVLVAQYANSSLFNAEFNSDPLMMLVPPYEQWLQRYDVPVPDSGFTGSYANIIVPSAGAATVMLDGVPVPSSEFTAIGSGEFLGATVALTAGAAHRFESTYPLLVSSYGFGYHDAYGAPAGTDLAPIGSVAQLSLTPETATNPVGSMHCVVASVADAGSNPLAGVRVDFTISGTGPDTETYHIPTAATGDAQLCYSSADAGTDTIVARVGLLTDTATKTWTAVVEGNWRLKGEGWVGLGGKGRNKLTFNVLIEKHGATLRPAKFHWKDHVARVGGRATAFDRVYRVDNTVYFEGQYRLSNGDTGTFAAAATDVGQHGDLFELTLSNGFHVGAVLGGGQVKVTDRK